MQLPKRLAPVGTTNCTRCGRLTSGWLVRNPHAEWNISDKTRDDLRPIIAEAFEQKTTMDELATAIQTAGTFSDSRAALIATTETIRAENQGNLAGWRGSGMVQTVDWMLSADFDEATADCDCGDNADNSPYPSMTYPSCQTIEVAAAHLPWRNSWGRNRTNP